MKIRWEISFGAILQALAYIAMFLFFAAKLSAEVDILKTQNDEIKKQMQHVSDRIDYHIDRSK